MTNFEAIKGFDLSAMTDFLAYYTDCKRCLAKKDGQECAKHGGKCAHMMLEWLLHEDEGKQKYNIPASIKKLPCSHCGGYPRVKLIDEEPDGTPIFVVEYDKCSARTGRHFTAENALKAWNSRYELEY